MDLLYRMAGMVARLAERGSRYRVNGLGANWWFLALGIFIGCAATFQVIEAVKNRGDVATVTLAQALGGEGMVDRRIAVKGAIDADNTLTKRDKDGNEKDPDEMYIPLVDEDASKAVYVKFDVKKIKDGAHDGYVRGMLRKMDNSLHSHVLKTAPESVGIRIDDRFMLVAGETPATMWIWVAVASAVWFVVLLEVNAIARRYVIFRRTGTPMARLSTPVADAKAAMMRASGVFCFNEKDRRRFFNVPSFPVLMESNDPAVIANVDASESWMGAQTRRLAGTWAMIMKAGTISAAEYGELYAGARRLPAIHVRYVDAVSGEALKAVFSFDNDADRERGREAIYNPQPLPPPDPSAEQPPPPPPGTMPAPPPVFS